MNSQKKIFNSVPGVVSKVRKRKQSLTHDTGPCVLVDNIDPCVGLQSVA